MIGPHVDREGGPEVKPPAGPATAEQGAGKERISVEIAARGTAGLPLLASRVPLIDTIRVSNRSGSRFERATLSFSLSPHGGAAEIRLPAIHPGEALSAGPLDLPIPAERLAAVQQPEEALLSWKLSSAGQEIASGSLPLRVLPSDEWPGGDAPISVLASLLTPSDPVVAVIVRRLTGTGPEGQPRSASLDLAASLAEALFGAIRALGLRETEQTGDIESGRAQIRPPQLLLEQQRASRLELALLFASCLERMSLSPLLLSAGDRLLVGLWLTDERFPEGVVYDLPRIRAATQQILWFDPRLALPEGGSFEDSRASARAIVRDDIAARWALDVRALRTDGVTESRLGPSASRPKRDGSRPVRPIVAEILAEAERASQPSAQGPVSLSEDRTLVTAIPRADDPVATRFRQWKDRLLDLSLRNRLLAFRLDAKTTLPLDVPDLARFVDLLSDRAPSDTVIEILPQHTARRSDPELPLSPQPDPSVPPVDLTPTERPSPPAEVRPEETDPDEALEDMPTEEVSTLTLPDRLARAALPAASPEPPAPTAEPPELPPGKVRADLPAEERFSRAVSLDRAARTHLEEGGANTLFVAIGFLSWRESSSAPARTAPLLLVPVALELHRGLRAVKLRRRGEDPFPNVTLVEKLRRDFDLDLSKISDFETEEHAIDIEAVLGAAAKATEAMSGWEVVRRAALGQFVFGKFLLWRDLEDNAQKLLESPVVQHIARRALAPYPNPTAAPEPRELDRSVPPATLPLVLDADSTQTAAIVGALQGRSFVLQGPPGTGKSQTIANLVAAAIADARTVLVVAEKMAALEVVHRRLKACGLGDFCLELHSHKTSKRTVISELASALKRESSGLPPPWEQRSAELKAAREDLNSYVQALHTVRANGSTFYAAAARQLPERERPTVPLAIESAGALSDGEIRALQELASRFATAARTVSPVPAHPWRDTRPGPWSANLEETVTARITKAIDAIAQLLSSAMELSELLSADSAALTTLPRIEALAKLGAELGRSSLPPLALSRTEGRAFRERVRNHTSRANVWTARTRTVAQRWHPTIYELDLDGLYARFARFSEWWFPLAALLLWAARREVKRAARRTLPDNRSITTDLSLARETARMKEPLAEERRALVAASKGSWNGNDPEDLNKLIERADSVLHKLDELNTTGVQIPDTALSVADPEVPADRRKALAKRSNETSKALDKARSALGTLSELLGAEKPPPEQPIQEIRAQLSRWQTGMKHLRDWAMFCELGAELAAHGLTPLFERHRSGEVEASALQALFERSLRKLWLDRIRDSEPALRSFSGAERHRQVERFRRLDRERLGLSRARVRAQVSGRAPMLAAEVAETSEPGILLRESAKKTRQKSVRRLLAEIPNLVSRLKPCLLMSPLSVAQYLPADGRKFDLVIFDEASQIGTHDAIGALARGNQVVVVGDSRQLPPTTFFQRAGGEEGSDENDYDELESILDEAVASGLPEQMLGWHYRSRHEALIRFSNEHYYNGLLALFPTAQRSAPDLGIRWHHVEGGVYDKSRTRTNRAEAVRLVEHLVARLVSFAPSERTFGVVTFSTTQQLLVSDLLDEARRTSPAIERHFSGEEPVFVKNLENVQGDERDEILFSIGYGPDEHGRLWMNFGPLNREGGERRLNVAVTRARHQLHVFSTITHHQIDLAKTRSKGARHLKDFLRYAEEQGGGRGEISDPITPATRFEQEVCDALRELGHDVALSVGCGDYRIDIAVLRKEDGSYLLGIELDGESYRRAATATDRDRLRAEILAGLGWRLHRIWSLDWWYARDAEIVRLKEAVERAISEGPLAPQEPPPVTESWTVPPSRPLLPPEAQSEDSAPRLEEGSGESLEGAPPARIAVRLEPYTEANPSVVSEDGDSLHSAEHFDELRRVVQQVIDVEGPIHIALLTRRVAPVFGVTKITQRAQRRVLAAAKKLSPAPIVRDNILWPAGADPAAYYRVRAGTRAPEHLPPEEVAAAASLVLAGNLAMPYADLVKATAKRFGITRVGKKAAKAMEDGIAVLISRGDATVKEDRIVGR